MTRLTTSLREFTPMNNPRPGRVIERLKRSGFSQFARFSAFRLSQRMGARFSWRDFDLPLRPSDLMESGSLDLDHAPALSGPLRIGWVCTAPGPGSGGHTTLFRMVKGLEERGHSCTLFLYDHDSNDVSGRIATVRRYWPEMEADIRSATPAIDGVDAVVASSWATAHVVAALARGPIHRFYFIQDYEPYFYPRGELYSFAEDTYKFGFSNIALGNMVAKRLQLEAQVKPDFTVPFGCDTDIYGLQGFGDRPPRNGVVFYARPNADRRGYLLGRLAIELFHERHPEQHIHVVGDTISGWTVPTINHGRLSPAELNVLFNRSITGIAMSFTNVSLSAEEMLAAGCLPVINDSIMARADLTSEFALWTPPAPKNVADALSRAVERSDLETNARLAALSVRRGWGETQRQVAEAIESVCNTGL
ncbi:rhamnosyltransferase WsaF family glycosyltransferase [Pseudarthrobacter sulfonivorans]|uniref:rhamnosyltransferase WsaF family glycosyltransferase n=1 Tax=Pseudarthrobacter sulfonivorans TaxID=121292 RepID=UPI0021072EE4|nr:glycosyltransferase family 1 protein [Pseudarthrobacter sulfonivorans]